MNLFEFLEFRHDAPSIKKVSDTFLMLGSALRWHLLSLYELELLV